MQNSTYMNTWAISQSMIKDFRFKSPKKWKQIWIDKQEDLDKSEDGFIFGSLVDTLMFTPEVLEERFYVSNQKLPSKAIESIIKEFYQRISKMKDFDMEYPEPIEYDMEQYVEILISCADDYNEEGKRGWNNTWKKETRAKSLFEKGQEYLKDLAKCDGRKIISQEMNFDAIALRDILKNDEDTRTYFIPSEDVELLFQFEIFADHTLSNGSKIAVKGALDILRIDHAQKTLQIVDFKTSYSAHDFISSIKKYGYATQLSYYDHLLRLWLDTQCEGRFCDYTILNPMNIVIDKYDKVPYIYEYSWHDLNLEKDGNEEYLQALYQNGDHNDKIKKGWNELLETIGWHFMNDRWDKPKELYENKKIKVRLLNV